MALTKDATGTAPTCVTSMVPQAPDIGALPAVNVRDLFIPRLSEGTLMATMHTGPATRGNRRHVLRDDRAVESHTN